MRGFFFVLSYIGICFLGATVPTTQATAADGFYIGGGAGILLPHDGDISNGAPAVTGEIDREDGFLGAGSLGYQTGDFRLELELAYRESDVDAVSGLTTSGEEALYSAMVNGIYMIPTSGELRPYVGVGMGYGRLKLNGVAPVAGSTVDDEAGGLAVQALAGVEYALSDRLKLNLGYRFITLSNLNYTTNGGSSFDTDYNAHAVMAGLRLSFPAPRARPPAPIRPAAAPAPAPAPAPAQVAQPAPPPPPRTFIVFFDWDSAALTQQARDIVVQAASAADTLGVARIVATGHADRSGPSQYNLGLSNRRADTVRAALRQLGYKDGEISIVSKGETVPLVPTADGVREPQNRRVEIVLE